MVEVELDQTEAWGEDQEWQVLAERAVAEAFAVAGVPPDRGISLSICLATDDEVQALNAQWRDKDKPTNVLSFPMLEKNELLQLRHPRAGGGPSPTVAALEAWEMDSRLRGNDECLELEVLLGDLILAHGVCAAEAEEKGIPLADHVTHLIIHGTLHLLGYDHMNDTDAEHMEALEVKALASLGLPNPY
jgi:probable rRNA maturation factor